MAVAVARRSAVAWWILGVLGEGEGLGGVAWPYEGDARHHGDRGRLEAATHAAERLGAAALLQ